MKKVLVGLAVVTFLVTGSSFPSRGLAQTSDLTVQDLQAQIEALLAQIRQLQAQLQVIQGGGSVSGGAGSSGSGPGPTVTLDPSQKFKAGDRVRSNFDLNVRETPGGRSLAVVPPLTQGTIAGGPESANGYYWWRIDYDIKVGGFSVGDFLEKIDVVSPSPSGNLPPVLAEDAFVSPTSVGTNQSNWWKLLATDPEGSQINYKVEWGDGTSDGYVLGSGQSAPAHHWYKQLGTFYLKMTATDQGGASLTRALTVEVIDVASVLPKPSTKFVLGDTVQTTDYLNVRTGPSGAPSGVQSPGVKAKVVGGPVWSIVGRWWWSLDYESGTDGWSAEDWLTKISGPVLTYACGDIDLNGVIDQNDLDDPSSEIDITGYIFGGVPIPTGVNVDLNGDGIPNILDVTILTNYLNRGGPVPTCGAITVLSPNGGEVWSMNVQHTISWTPDSNSTAVEAYLEKKVGDSFVNVGKVVPVGRGSIIWDGEIDTHGSYSTPSGSYYIRVYNPLTGQSGRSAAPFQLVKYNSVTAVSIDTVNGVKPTGVLYGNPAADVLSTDTTIALGWSSKLTDGTCQVRIYDASTQGGTTFVQNLPLNGERKFNLPPGTGLYYIAHVDCSDTRDASGSAFVYLQQKTGKAILACGDIDLNGVIDQNDLNNPSSENDITGYIFGGVPIPVGLNVDLNGDGRPDILDVTMLTNYLNRGGPAPTCAPTPNRPPVISIVSGLTSLAAGQSGTWAVAASDPDGNALAYSVVWGDGTPDLSSTAATFAHTYSSAGTYTAKFLVSDGKGEKAAKDVVVKVAPAPVRLASGFFCGDIDLNGVINQNDLDNPSSSIDITGYVFEGEPIPAGLKVDLNADGYPDILDVTVLTNYLKRGGPAPTCGVTSTSTTSAAAVLSSISSQLQSISNQIGSWLGQ